MGALSKRRRWSGVELAGAARVLWAKMPVDTSPLVSWQQPKLSSTPMHHPKPPYVPHVRGSQVARLVWHLHHLHPSAGELANDAVIGGEVGVRAVACGGWREAVLVEGFSQGPTRQSSLYTKTSFPKRPQKTSWPHAYLAPPPAYPKRIFSQPALSLAQPRSHPNDPPSLPSTQRHLDSPPRCLGLASTRISPACHLARQRRAQQTRRSAVHHQHRHWPDLSINRPCPSASAWSRIAGWGWGLCTRRERVGDAGRLSSSASTARTRRRTGSNCCSPMPLLCCSARCRKRRPSRHRWLTGGVRGWEGGRERAGGSPRAGLSKRARTDQSPKFKLSVGGLPAVFLHGADQPTLASNRPIPCPSQRTQGHGSCVGR